MAITLRAFGGPDGDGGPRVWATRVRRLRGIGAGMGHHGGVSARRPGTSRTGRPVQPRARTAARPSGTRSTTARATAARPATSHSASARSTGPAKPSGKPAAKPAAAPGRGRSARERGRGSGGATVVDESEPRQITVRMIVFFAVILLAFILLAPTLRAYVSQQEQLRSLNSQLADAQARTAALEADVERWNNDDFARSQARERLGFVMPGETPFRVLDPETVTGEQPAQQEAPAGVEGVDERAPWYISVWNATKVAGEVEPG